MTCCSVRWCGKSSKTSNYKTDGITFHRFPKDPKVKEQWIDCVKRENWFPSYFNAICSSHFTEDCFHTTKNRRRLFNSAIPTLNLPVVSNISVPENTNPIPSSSSPNESISTTQGVTNQIATDPETPSELDPMTNKRLRRRVLQLQNQAKQKNRKIKILQDKLRYYKNKVETLQFILKNYPESTS